MSQTAAAPLPMILDEVEVARVERLSPSFVRVELGGACLAEFGVEGPTYDQRIKLVFPGVPGGPLPRFETDGDSWYTAWMALPEDERGHMVAVLRFGDLIADERFAGRGRSDEV